jgi:heme/copper-type cytochrome/quinol oxidase subunit 2
VEDQRFYNLIALAAAVIVIGAFGIGYLGSSLEARGTPVAPPSATGTAPAPTIYLTINLNPLTGMPQYTPANFSVPRGLVNFVLTDYDSVMSWPGCTCNVTGTVNDIELLNNTPVSAIPASNVAHTFTIYALGLMVLSPGMSTITFAVDFDETGAFPWECVAPCGTGGVPFTTPPMGSAGYMSGTVTVG